jgi:DNA polymerase III gamma/tau subunit
MYESLVEKYRPREIKDFLGLDVPKRALTALLAKPRVSNWIFVGPPGTGKTEMATVVAKSLTGSDPLGFRSRVHHVGSQKCTVEEVDEIVQYTWLSLGPGKLHCVIVDEADSMSLQAQKALLSVLDGSRCAPRTVFIFTCNDTAKLEERFRNRCIDLPFTACADHQKMAEWLAGIWALETGNAEPRPDFLRMAEVAGGSVRGALEQQLALEILLYQGGHVTV